METLLRIMRKAIIESGQSRYRISQATGVAQSQLSRILSGERGMSLETFERLAEHLGLEIIVRPKRRQSKDR